LLPFLTWDEEDEGEELTRQLKIYKEYLEAMKTVQGLIGKKHYAYAREKLLTTEEIGFAPPPKLTKEKVSQAFYDIIKALDPVLNLPQEVIKRTINIQEKISQIRQRIFRETTTRFSEIIKEAKDRTEVIVSFLALLELIKQRHITVKQSNVFDDIEIEKIKE